MAKAKDRDPRCAQDDDFLKDDFSLKDDDLLS
jgi:hypothetical protein